MSRKPPSKPPSQRRGDERPEDAPPPGTFRASLADPSVRQGIQDAGIIFGVDAKGRESLFFGKATLERIIKTGKAKESLVLRVPLDFATDDVEALAAACLALKGSHCYQTPDGQTDDILPGLN